MRIVWLCHFNNDYISECLGIKAQFEYAPWISQLIEIFKDNYEVEIHIVSPNPDIYRHKNFEKKNIYFHFFPYLIPLLPKRISNILHNYTNFFFIKHIVNRLINKIHPDLIHMFGTENAYFTSSIFQFKNLYPVFITIQGFVNKEIDNNYQFKKRKEVEIKIIKEFNNFGVRDEAMVTFLKNVNPRVKLFIHEISPYKPKYSIDPDENKVFDVVFFARVTREKGIEDLIEAISLLSKKGRDVKTCVIGPATEEYYEYLKRFAIKLGVQQNIIFKGSLRTIDDVHKLAVQSHISVLPTHADSTPGTLIESMFMGIPCISYTVGGIPAMNESKEIIRLVEPGNISQLATDILFLLNNPDYAQYMAAKAKHYVDTRWSELGIQKSIIQIYHKVLLMKFIE